MPRSRDPASLARTAGPRRPSGVALHPLLAAQRLAGNQAVARLVAQRQIVDEPKAAPNGMQAILDAKPKSASPLSPGARTLTAYTPPEFLITSRGTKGFAFVHTGKASVKSTCMWPTTGDHAMTDPKPPTTLPRVIRVGPDKLVNKLRDGEHEHSADAEVVFAATLGCASAAMAKLDGTTAPTEAELSKKFVASLPTRWAKVADAPWVADFTTLFNQARGRRDPYPHLAGISGSTTTLNGKDVWLDELQEGQAFEKIKAPADTSQVTKDAATLQVCPP